MGRTRRTRLVASPGQKVNVNVIETDWHACRWGLKRPLSARFLGRGGADLSTGSINVSRVRVKCRLLVDFDGTIASVDTTDHLLERFAAPAWRDIEEDWKEGRIGSRECMVRQIDLVRASQAEMDEFVAGIEIDPEFPAFAELCARLGHNITVVSDGLDRMVQMVLQRHGLELPYYANHLEWRGEDRWRLTFPHARSDCQSLAGNCKCGFTDAAPHELSIVVGDGRSDFCVAGRADLVLAKGTLLDHCIEADLPHVAFADFGEATEILAGWLERRSATELGQQTQRAED
jgi:2-hydroxy-3-keto-5-methylthiopentenyl-1-phosphate phosphatase